MKRMLGWVITVFGALIGILVVGLLTGRGPMPSVVDAIRGEAQLPTGTPGTLRDDALRLMWASAEIIGTAGYCLKYVEQNPELLTAVKAWNDRNHSENERIVEAAKRSGGLSAEEKDDFNRAAGARIKHKVEAQHDRRSYCREFASFLASGHLDLGRQQETAEALKRIQAGQ